MRLTTTTIEVPQSYVADAKPYSSWRKPKVEGFRYRPCGRGRACEERTGAFQAFLGGIVRGGERGASQSQTAPAELKMAEVEVDRIKRLVEKDIISPIRLEQAIR